MNWQLATSTAAYSESDFDRNKEFCDEMYLGIYKHVSKLMANILNIYVDKNKH